jgi:hypothetical protein
MLSKNKKIICIRRHTPDDAAWFLSSQAAQSFCCTNSMIGMAPGFWGVAFIWTFIFALFYAEAVM